MVSPRKSLTAVSEASRCDNNMSIPAKSCESLLSGSSRESASQIYQRKQPARGMKSNSTGGMRQPSMVPNNTSSDIHQRVMSARNLRAKTFQNQLADAQTEIANLAHENRMLRTMHKRQSMALNKYESTGAELPQLLHSHAEELRVWQTKHRNVQAVNKELEQKLKQKEAQILSLSDQNKHFSQLIKDKNLDERQKLQDKLRTMEQRLQEKDNDMKLMARKVQLETKNFRQQLLNEQKKCKEVMLKLEKARLEISGYRKLDEFTVDKVNPMTPGRRTKLAPTIEENEKIEKLEKSLELLDKAIEKNNQSEFNALTDVLETDSNFEFDKDDGDEEKNVVDGLDNKEGKPKRGKLTLPPATSTPPKLPSSNGPNPTRLSLSQILQNKPKPNPRVRATGGSAISGSISTMASHARTSINSKRQDSVAKLSLGEAGKSNKLQSIAKALDFDYDEEDSEHEHDFEDNVSHREGGNYGLADDVTDDNEDNNPNDDSPINYAAYLDTKGELSEMSTMDEGDDDDETDDVQSLKCATNDSLKGNPRVPIMKENISNLRKLISDDYKEREIFLDTHCRPSSGSTNSQLREDPTKKKRSAFVSSSSSVTSAAATVVPGGTMAGSRKHALLAALKVIDNDKDQD